MSSVGGFAGYSEFDITISNCYSKGNVTRSSGTSTTVAGFVGYNYGGTIEQCYSTGTVVYDGGINPTDMGFAGYDEEGTYSNNFFDATSSNQTTGIGATAKTTTEMKTKSTFTAAGWSESVWFMDNEINDGYPYLAWQNPDGTPMPAEIVSFSATPKGRGVELAWSTATEVNNYGFNIERRMKDELGSMNWGKIGFVEGRGTTNAPQSYSFIDNSASGTVVYRLKQIDRDGSFEYSNQVEVTIAAPKEFALMQNHPNPFNPTTAINYTLPVAGHVSLKVFDILGKEVATLVNGVQDAGAKIASFNASQLPSGIYFYTLRTQNFSATRKMMLLK
jgi:hypothetical protein